MKNNFHFLNYLQRKIFISDKFLQLGTWDRAGIDFYFQSSDLLMWTFMSEMLV